MNRERVTSDLFIGRTQELDHFAAILQPESKVRVFSIHTDGKGGIGKTQLLLRMQKAAHRNAEKIVSTNALVDFYDVETRTKLGVMRRIADSLEPFGFSGFKAKAKEYEESKDIGKREKVFKEIESEFRQEYRDFAERKKSDEKIIVLFFDSYEYVQAEIAGPQGKRVDPTEFSNWFENDFLKFFPGESDNTRIVVAGRYPLQEVALPQAAIEAYRLAQFSLNDTKAFLKECFKKEIGADQLLEVFDSENEIEIYHQLADGQPILLALLVDLIKIGESNTRDLLTAIEKRAGKIAAPVSATQREIFEKELVAAIPGKLEPPDRILTYLAVAYRRLTPEILHLLANIPLSECQEVFARLKTWSFIKSKKDEIILLHDEMRRLIKQHTWGEQRDSYRETIAKPLVAYYENTLLQQGHLSVVDRETYESELLGYSFFAAPVETVQGLFSNMFDTALRNGKYDYADLILREAEYYHHENPNDIPFPHFIEIFNRRMQYYIEVARDYPAAKKLASLILEEHASKPDWEDSDVHARLLLEEGNAEYWTGKFDSALALYFKAKEIFHISGNDYWVYKTLNLIGYAQYRRGLFKEAEDYFLRSCYGFYRILAQPEAKGKSRLELLDGLQYPLGNLAMVCRYTGRFDLAVRYADIQLYIVEALPENSREVARTLATLSHVLAFRGRSVDALRLAQKAEELLRNIHDRVLQGRVQMNLAWAAHRTDELNNLLEYYRAEELTDLLLNKNYVDQNKLVQSRDYLKKAIEVLGEEPPIDKELADAYFILGEMYLAFHPERMPDKFEQAEKALVKALEHSKKSGFAYRAVDTIESLVLLYYFWNEATESTEIKAKCRQKAEKYRDEFEKNSRRSDYLNLLARYKVTVGDMKFDEALRLLRSKKGKNFEDGIKSLKEAFYEYFDSARLKKVFNEDRYYMMLRIIYNRLSTLVELTSRPAIGTTIAPEKKIPAEIYAQIDALAAQFEKDPEIKQVYDIFQYVRLLIDPEYKPEQIRELEAEIQRVREGEKLRWAVLLNDCFIKICRFLTLINPDDDEAREKLVLSLNSQVSTYRILGDEYHARRFVQIARAELGSIKDANLKKALEGRTNASEGELAYRRGEYERPFEFYLRGELELGRKRFAAQYPQGHKDALTLLQQGENTLSAVIQAWQAELINSSGQSENCELIEKRIRVYRQKLAETYFRLGELLLSDERFDDDAGSKGAFSYFEAAINESQASKYEYRYYDAIQSYVAAYYFSPQNNTPLYEERQQKSKEYEETFEQVIKSLDAGEPKFKYIWLLGRLRITQADTIFIEYFPAGGSGKGDAKLSTPAKTKMLRKMLGYYIEACNFKAQYHQQNYEQCFEILLRRFDKIFDHDSLNVIRNGLPEIWNSQKSLKNKSGDLEMLLNYLTIRSVILENAKPNPK